MSAIMDALKAREIRIDNGDRWLVWDNFLNMWVVYHRGYRKRTTKTLVETEDEALALRHLLRSESL